MDPTQQRQHPLHPPQQGNPETASSSAGAAYLLQQLHVGGSTGYTVGVPPSHQQSQQHQQRQQLGVPPQQQFQLISSAPTTTSQIPNFIHFPATMTMTQTMSNAGGQTESMPRLHLSQQQQFNERERQIKRRTKTGCMTCRKRRIKCDEGKPFCYNCQKSHRECEGYQTHTASNSGSKRSESNTPPGFASSNYASDYSTPSNLSAPNSTFSPINSRRAVTTHPQSPRFTPYDVYPRTPIEQSLAKEFDPLNGSEYLATDFANDASFFTDFSSPMKQEDLSTPPPAARISIDSLLNLSSAALIHPAIDAPLDALFSPTTSLTPPALLKPNNLQLFAHWINILSPAMATLDRFPTDSSILETTPGIHYPIVRVPHEDAVYSFLIPHLAMAPTGTGVLHALLACAASHRQDRRLGQKNYHLAVRALRSEIEHGVSYFVAVTLLGMYEVLGGSKTIRCMHLAKDWILQHKAELMAKMHTDDMEVTVRDVIIENMKWTFARTAVHRGFSSLLAREGFILPMSEFRDLYIPREGSDSTVGVADSLVILLAQVISLPSMGELELKAHIANQLYIWPSTLPRMFRHQWTSQNTISTTSLNAIHFLHPSMAAIHLLHRAGIIYFSIAFNFNISRKSSPEAIAAARDVLRITQPLIDEAASGRWSVLGALTLAFGPVFIAGEFLKFHLRDTPFVLPSMDWLDESLGEIVETEEDVELREVERMIDKLKILLGGVEGRVMEL